MPPTRAARWTIVAGRWSASMSSAAPGDGQVVLGAAGRDDVGAGRPEPGDDAATEEPGAARDEDAAIGPERASGHAVDRLRRRAAIMGGVRVAYTLEQCWHDVPGGTAVAAIEVARRLAPRERRHARRRRRPPPRRTAAGVAVADPRRPAPAAAAAALRVVAAAAPAPRRAGHRAGRRRPRHRPRAVRRRRRRSS